MGDSVISESCSTWVTWEMLHRREGQAQWRHCMVWKSSTWKGVK